MTRRNSIPIVRLRDVRSVAKWLESLGQCPRSISEDIESGGEYFVAFSQGQGKPAVLGWFQVSDGTICMNVDPVYAGKEIASLMLDFLEERLVTAISHRSVQLV